MKTAIWKKDWFTGLAVVILVMAVHSCSPIIKNLERSAYDVGVRGSSREPAENIAIIELDDQSIENIGRWPWSREIHAEVIDKLTAAGAKVIAYTPIFSEPQVDPGLDYINALIEYYQASGLAQTDAENPNALDQHGQLFAAIEDPELNEQLSSSFAAISQPINEIESSLYEAQQTLNVDQKLADAFAAAGNVITPMLFRFGQPFGKPDQPLPVYVQNMKLENTQDRIGAQALGIGFLPLETNSTLATPISGVGQAALGVGNINNLADIDGGIRAESLVVDYFGELYPSYSLVIAAKSLNLDVGDITVRLGEGIQLGRLNINTDPQLRMLSFFYRSAEKPAFSSDSFFDVMLEKVPASKYKGKIVIVGATASGVSKPQLTPIGALTEAETLAHTVSSILNEDFFKVPSWSIWTTISLVLLVSIFIIAFLPRLGAGLGATTSVLLLVVLFATHYFLMTTQALWVQLMLPISLLSIGYIVLTTKRFLVTERGKLHSDLESAESNKMLGLAFQGQGQLDMAFEKFRKCPKNDAIAEVLYNLALDYERKRQFAKAGNVYRYIGEFSPQFRDVKQRIERSEKMENTIVLGGGGASTAAGTLIMDGGDVEKPMLGRYQVEKELGKGAMGVVYLGKDPKISRIVAIKTMALSQEFEADELEEVKARFFREAETAGRLNHPNIVTIYDAGEEHDLAYIAMEFLKGHDLARYTKKDQLLPLATVLDIIKKSADALTYAHQQNVVHRDIKPANIMYEPDSNSVKITDFGIARITDSSKTKTGMVLGTPSYMSPEQLAGKKVDGRSDIFSLGVMLFQLTTGQLPFKADSMATLMYKIANDPHPSVLDANPKLPPGLELIVAKALEKKAEDRYQSAAELSADIAKLVSA